VYFKGRYDKLMTEHNDNDIAVIGMSGRFPGANSVNSFWENLIHAKESITRFSDDELITNGIAEEDILNPNYVRAKAIMHDADMFDASYFNYSTLEASLIDPQHRCLLEETLLALKQCKVDTHNDSNVVGLYVSSSFNTYILELIKQHPYLLDSNHFYQLVTANGVDFLASRISHKLNLTGPSQVIQSACSSSLLAVHNACQGLLNYDCNISIAGGVSITTPLKSGYMYKKEGIASADGHCRPFDKNASGTVPGNGLGVVILKRLEDAIDDHDTIYAVIKGTATNNDGANKMSYNAPSVLGQTRVIKHALAVTEIDPSTIEYIEAHGTGTLLGDPIEMEAISTVHKHRDSSNPCKIGSVKSNIGHLDAAAGIAGFIKTVLSLHHKKIPPSINFETGNENIPFSSIPISVNTSLHDWQRNKLHPRRASISSFGMGGCNVHAIIEESPLEQATSAISPPINIFNRRRFWIDTITSPAKTTSTGTSQHTILETLTQTLENLTGDTIDDTELTFDELNVDSFMTLDFILEIETSLKISVTLQDFTTYPTLKALSQHITNLQQNQTASDPATHKNYIHLNTISESAITLFCLYPAGGSVAIFKEFARHMPETINVIGLESDHLTDNTTIQDIAIKERDRIKAIQPEGPYRLFGASIGGNIAFEISKLLLQHNEEVALLAMADSPPPGLAQPTHDNIPDSNEQIIEYIKKLSPDMSKQITDLSKTSHQHLEQFFDNWRIHKQSLYCYETTAYHDNVVYFLANEKTNDYALDIDVTKWQPYFHGNTELITIDGNHISMFSGNGAKQMAHYIQTSLLDNSNTAVTTAKELEEACN